MVHNMLKGDLACWSARSLRWLLPDPEDPSKWKRRNACMDPCKLFQRLSLAFFLCSSGVCFLRELLSPACSCPSLIAFTMAPPFDLRGPGVLALRLRSAATIACPFGVAGCCCSCCCSVAAPCIVSSARCSPSCSCCASGWMPTVKWLYSCCCCCCCSCSCTGHTAPERVPLCKELISLLLKGTKLTWLLLLLLLGRGCTSAAAAASRSAACFARASWCACSSLRSSSCRVAFTCSSSASYCLCFTSDSTTGRKAVFSALSRAHSPMASCKLGLSMRQSFRDRALPVRGQ
mmetsp:Transcript_11813/g.32207  ORF Transcript_11813/g.32207 Transcript_11813/m.32207 type:complete len:290 (-) Transcript_11813:1080-1949(-)